MFNSILGLKVKNILTVFVCIGGNAGMATAYAARKLNLPATIVLPSSTPQLVAQKLKDQGATVKVVGKAREKYHHSYPK